MRLVYIILCIIAIWSSNCALSQDIINKQIINDYTTFELIQNEDTLSFIVADTNLREEKPILLFCQGSKPVPLIIKMNDGDTFVWGGGLSNFDYKEISSKFHIVVISSPHTPLIAEQTHLNNEFGYVTDTNYVHSFRKDYILNDRLPVYIDRANKVLQFVYNQSWSKKEPLIVAGHSQGAVIALELANTRNDVKGLGLLSLDPLGRMTYEIVGLRNQVATGKISSSEWEKRLEQVYDFVKQYNDTSNWERNPSLHPWKSFSKMLVDDLIKVTCPIYIAYGGKDDKAASCDLLPIYFENNNKKDYIVKLYPDLEHNFFPVNKSNYENNESKWPEVMDEFYKWITSKNEL
ncbi:MAG: dienelactone hydrolase family protein [Brumimicrobium sp.]|nr:dienelactone hydrolase family protein [Brumimicrobium sp.]